MQSNCTEQLADLEIIDDDISQDVRLYFNKDVFIILDRLGTRTKPAAITRGNLEKITGDAGLLSQGWVLSPGFTTPVPHSDGKDTGAILFNALYLEEISENRRTISWLIHSGQASGEDILIEHLSKMPKGNNLWFEKVEYLTFLDELRAFDDELYDRFVSEHAYIMFRDMIDEGTAKVTDFVGMLSGTSRFVDELELIKVRLALEAEHQKISSLSIKKSDGSVRGTSPWNHDSMFDFLFIRDTKTRPRYTDFVPAGNYANQGDIWVMESNRYGLRSDYVPYFDRSLAQHVGDYHRTGNFDENKIHVLFSRITQGPRASQPFDGRYISQTGLNLNEIEVIGRAYGDDLGEAGLDPDYIPLHHETLIEFINLWRMNYRGDTTYIETISLGDEMVKIWDEIMIELDRTFANVQASGKYINHDGQKIDLSDLLGNAGTNDARDALKRLKEWFFNYVNIGGLRYNRHGDKLTGKVPGTNIEYIAPPDFMILLFLHAVGA